MKINGPHALGDLYDILEATRQQAKPRGVWNKVRIVSVGKHVEHWLNGKKVLVLCPYKYAQILFSLPILLKTAFIWQ
jgi:hypothetical protein